MCDMFLEMIKTITISQSEIEKRFKFNNLEVYLELEKNKKYCHTMCPLCELRMGCIYELSYQFYRIWHL
ncbi:lipid A biosynthesis acyltransferase [Flavobacterium psychrophilum]|nr:lipid A biosynthesis acyltransferase [Flavobacterium psychrophilum]